MYAYIRGVVDSVGADRAIIDALGVGYELICSANTLKRVGVGSQCRLLVHLQFSQDAQTLYGFFDEEEREMFRKLIAVSKIGPKTAISILGSLTPQDITTAILTENVSAFDGVSGIGKKTAARLLLELKGNIGAFGTTAPESVKGGQSVNEMRTEAVAALVSLGYDGVTEGRAVAAASDCERLEDMISEALRAIPSGF